MALEVGGATYEMSTEWSGSAKKLADAVTSLASGAYEVERGRVIVRSGWRRRLGFEVWPAARAARRASGERASSEGGLSVSADHRHDDGYRAHVRLLALPISPPDDSASDDDWDAFEEFTQFESQLAGTIASRAGGRPIDRRQTDEWRETLRAHPEWDERWAERVTRIESVLDAIDTARNGLGR